MAVANLPPELWTHILSCVALKQGLFPFLTVSKAVGELAERVLYRDGMARFIDQDVIRPVWQRIAEGHHIARHIRAIWFFPINRGDLDLIREVLKSIPNLKSVFLALTHFTDPRLEMNPWSIIIPQPEDVPFQLQSLTVRTEDYLGMRQFMRSHQSIYHLAVYHGVTDSTPTEDPPEAVQFSPEDVPGLWRLSVDDTDLASRFLPHCTLITHFEISSTFTLEGLEECSNVRALKCRVSLQEDELEKIPKLFPNLEFLSVSLNEMSPDLGSLVLKIKTLRKLKVWVNNNKNNVVWPGKWVKWAEIILISNSIPGSGSQLEVVETLYCQPTGPHGKVDIVVVQINAASVAPRQIQQLTVQGDDLETQKNEWMWWGTKERRG